VYTEGRNLEWAIQKGYDGEKLNADDISKAQIAYKDMQNDIVALIRDLQKIRSIVQST